MDEEFREIIIEVENPEAAVILLNQKIISLSEPKTNGYKSFSVD